MYVRSTPQPKLGMAVALSEGMSTRAWLSSMVVERRKNPFVFEGTVELRSLHQDLTFRAGVSPDGEELVGFLAGHTLVDTWSLGARAVLFNAASGTIALTSEVIAFRGPEAPQLSAPTTEIVRTNAAIPLAKMLREEQKKRVRPPTYTSPDLGSSTRVNLSLLDEYLTHSKAG